ncbi:MAG TPA: glycosyltransferase [Solirubrobacteraceae bacterium]|nr:glycosyltransferase [Solirubrobacteraceae bacterium]
MSSADGQMITAGGPSVYGLAAGTDVGGELYERELVRRLPAHGVRVLIGMPPDHGLEPTPGVRAVALPRPASLHWTWAPLVFVPWALALVLGRRADVLRAPSVRYAGPSLLAVRALCGRRRAPVAIHHHHFEPRWRRLEAWILRRADVVLAVSEHERLELERAGVDPARITVAHNGVEGPAVRAPEPPETWPAEGLRLLYLGRLEARKRPELAVRTLAELIHAGHPASLALAGEGPERGPLAEAASALGVGNRVRFLGRVDDARKWALYDGAELLLFGSTLEGFGLVVAEAQSRGLPAVAARGTATAEALRDGETGLLVEPTAAAFAAAVVGLLDPERRTAMGAAARAFAARFSWDACAAGVADALRAVAGSS